MEGHPERDDRGERSSVLPQVLIALVGLYLTGFGAIVLDELVFRTFVLTSHLSDQTQHVVEIIYWPLIQLIFLLP